MIHPFGAVGWKGSFYCFSVKVLESIRKAERMLLANLELFLYDPVSDGKKAERVLLLTFNYLG